MALLNGHILTTTTALVQHVLKIGLATSELLNLVDYVRIEADQRIARQSRALYGQYMTPAPIARFMASLFREPNRKSVRLLDAGAGVGSLVSAFVDDMCLRTNTLHSIAAITYEIDPALAGYLQSTLQYCEHFCRHTGIDFHFELHNKDFVSSAVNALQADELFRRAEPLPGFTHAILNPPYKKIRMDSEYRTLLRKAGIEASNLYSGFIALACELLEAQGEMVAIVPRSFCNGPYFKPFRKFFFSRMALRRIHVFESRNETFRANEVLQENVILYAVKGEKPNKVVVSASRGVDMDELTVREIEYRQVLNSEDPDLLIYIVTNEIDQQIAELAGKFDCRLEELGIDVSTGPVVDFRLKDYLYNEPIEGTVPLIYPFNIRDNFISWPRESPKKPLAIADRGEAEKWLMPNEHFTIIKRFSSKEESRRIVAAVHDPSRIPGARIGFENHLNVFHSNGRGLDATMAKGLAVFLNSSLIDSYFRQFNGHTQVNVSDLKKLRYPTKQCLLRLGRKVRRSFPSQEIIDALIKEELDTMNNTSGSNPLDSKLKIKEALEILKALDLPKGQHNERSALTLLALLDLKPEAQWSEAGKPLIGISPIMYFCRDHYGREYAPNTRETIRRQTIHQFVEAGLAVSNPDEPGRPVNSPKWCYQVTPEALKVIKTYKSKQWKAALAAYLGKQDSLAQRYARAREMQKLPVVLTDGKEIQLTPGKHSTLIGEIIAEFAPRFAPGSTVIYVGDTGKKWAYFDHGALSKLGVEIDFHGKMPDVVLHYTEKNWLLLIEAVTSHGPMNSKRYVELAALFEQSTIGLVYVTAFPSRNEVARFLDEISWETEVWVADSPTHLIHFDGKRFLGPYSE